MWDLESTSQLLRRLSCVSDPDELLRLVLGHVRRRVDLDRVLVISREGLEAPSFRVALCAEFDSHGVRTRAVDPDAVYTGGLLADLLRAGEFRTVPTLTVDAADPSGVLLQGSRMLVAFPLLDHAESVGMVVLLGPALQDCKPTDVCGLAIMGGLLQGLRRAHALTRQLEATCGKLDSELAAAAEVQRWLLPPPTPPAAGVEVAASYRPAHHSGGDYYDSGELPDGRFGVMIADVSGHDAAAAVLMAILRTTVHDELDQSLVATPATLLDYADDRLCRLDLSSKGQFITAFSGALHTTTGEFRYSSAGHPPPRLLRTRDRTITSLDGATTLPLGVVEERSRRAEESILLTPGDLLVLYSDGITEARSPAGEFFGFARLDEVLRDLPDPVTPEAAVAAIQRNVEAFTGAQAASDDQTLMAVQWHGVVPRPPPRVAVHGSLHSLTRR